MPKGLQARNERGPIITKCGVQHELRQFYNKHKEKLVECLGQKNFKFSPKRPNVYSWPFSPMESGAREIKSSQSNWQSISMDQNSIKKLLLIRVLGSAI